MLTGRPLHADPSVQAAPAPGPADLPPGFRPGPVIVPPAVQAVPYAQPSPPAAPVPPSRAPQPVAPAAVSDDSDIDHELVAQVKQQVADSFYKELERDPNMPRATQMQRGRALISDAVAVWGQATSLQTRTPTPPAVERRLAAAVFDLLFRAGGLQQYLDDENVENIFVNGYDRVFVDYGDSGRVRVPPVAASEDDLRDLLRDLARRGNSGERTLSTSAPFLALTLEDGSRMQVMTEVTPGDSTFVTIRRHRVRDIDLPGLVTLGTIDTTLQALLASLIKAKKNVMVVGTQGVGKTSLLRAMAREIPSDERYGTLETEFELFLHEGGNNDQIVPMEAREGNGETANGRAAGEITVGDMIYPALRMSLRRMVVGEVRGPEVVAMLRVMTNGEGGSLCTLHARKPHHTFDRIAELYLEYGHGMTEALAYRQCANGLDFVVFVTLVDEAGIGGRRHRFVSHVLEVTGMGENGRPATNTVFGPRPETGEQRAVPLMHPACLPDLVRAGFPAHLLDNPNGSWDRPLDLLVRVP
ncbi:CpaF family protein [Kitasatospora kifunensis]|uniref:Flp pilus assembly CpaF family ATPase n=1 Tax=Kitasatospora kifunensis TaxID=58351 RepID=A0A7W7W0X3_KITKI|nr:CpaF/VirB11 family protein [Kitasatospora kifunensis]MBB4929144.1 Flp pilus assembly CpaF family ATPase [Kitasatospora kifunensis]